MVSRRPPLAVVLLLVPLTAAGFFAACTPAAAPTGATRTTTSVPPVVSEPLSPARQIAGTWQTDSPVTFVYETDFCGARRDVGRASWTVTWIITAVSGFSNVIDVEMRFSRGSTTPVGNCQPNGYVPAVSPTFFRLCLSSSDVLGCTGENYKNGAGHGPFTSDLMQLTWLHWECLIYCSGEYTETNALKLRKRS